MHLQSLLRCAGKEGNGTTAYYERELDMTGLQQLLMLPRQGHRLGSALKQKSTSSLGETAVNALAHSASQAVYVWAVQLNRFVCGNDRVT